VTCLMVDPPGESAQGEFEAHPSKPLELLKEAATRNPEPVLGGVEFRRTGNGWSVTRVWVKTFFTW
jgi:hypothetical protein